MKQPWFKKNLKWLIPAFILLLIGGFGIAAADGSVTDIAQAYSDPALCQHAIDKANENPEVITTLGRLEPVDKLAIIEGTVIYSNNGNSVEATIRVKGSKAIAKMDLVAEKECDEWQYHSIRIRNKKTGSLIEIQ